MKLWTISFVKRARELIVKLWTIFIDNLYPHLCPSCKTQTDDESFCLFCWKHLRFIEGPCCLICGEPLDARGAGDLLCPLCGRGEEGEEEGYVFDRSLSAFIYNDTIAKAICQYKFKRHTFLSKFFAKFLLRKLKTLGDRVDFIIPVPIHKKRLLWRGYNQSLLLAWEISRRSSLECIPKLLLKVRETPSQTTLRFRKRKSNLRSAFVINEKHLELVRDKNILIVDDVFTSGSTANECAKVLKKNNVAKVFVLTVARTPTSKRRQVVRITRPYHYRDRSPYGSLTPDQRPEEEDRRWIPRRWMPRSWRRRRDKAWLDKLLSKAMK